MADRFKWFDHSCFIRSIELVCWSYYPPLQSTVLLKFCSFIYTATQNEKTQCVWAMFQYLEMAVTNKSIKTESLPPSERAAHRHSICVYLQVTYWKFLQENFQIGVRSDIYEWFDAVHTPILQICHKSIFKKLFL